MKFCLDHWDALRAEIDRVGLTSIIPENGEGAMRSMVSELQDGPTVDNFDPLMRAHNMIFMRAMEEIKDRYAQNPLMLMASSEEHPEWACPICAWYWCHDEHNRLCTKENCDWPVDFDWAAEMLGVSQVVLEEWQSFRV